MALSKIDAVNFLTGTIPSGNVANATLNAVTTLPGAIATGKVLQVVQTSSTATFSTTSTSMSEMINCSITPASSSNKILIHFSTNCQIVGSGNSYGRATVFRGTTSDTDLGAKIGGLASGTNNDSMLTGVYLDSPSTASSQQYTLAMSTASGSTTSAGNDSRMTNLILMEIEG